MRYFSTDSSGIKIITSNRKAFHEYTVGDRYEAGMVLNGTEVKAARAGKVNLNDGWIAIDDYGEAYLHEAHIAKYSHGSHMNHLETRPRKLLLHRKELAKLAAQTQEKGYTVIPLKMYFKDQYIKLEIGIARGKKLHDKRDSAATKDANREIERAMKHRR